MNDCHRRPLFALLAFGMVMGAGRIHAVSHTFVSETALRKVIVPAADIGTDWRILYRLTGSGWTNSRGGVGYEIETDYNSWFVTDLGSEMYGADKNTTCYLRLTFSIDPAILALSRKFFLDIRYDDGFVVWLNGQKIAEANAPADPTWNSSATQSHEAGDQPESFDISSYLGSLKETSNLLAIQGLNDSSSSPDFLISASLSVDVENALESVESNLPIIKIDTDGQTIVQDNRIAARMSIIDNGPGRTNHLTDPAGPSSGPINIEVRGQSSANWPKQQYNFETQNADSTNRNIKLLGFPEENDWVLNAPYIDKTFFRNALAYWFSNRLGLYATRTRFCEVELNGLYQGIYILMEKIKQDKNRVAIANLTPTDNAGDSMTGGYILKIDKQNYNGNPNPSFFSNYMSAGFFAPRTEYQFHDPKDDLTDVQKAYIQDFMNRFEDAMAGPNWADPVNGYSKWINVDTFIHFFFVNEIAKNVDAYRISTYFYKDRNDRDGRLCMGPVWDFDLAFGNANYFDGEDADDWMINTLQATNQESITIPFWLPMLFKDFAFRERVRERWADARQNALSIDSIDARIEAWADSLGPAVDRNFSIWSGPGEYGGGFWPIPNVFYGFQTYRDEIDYLKQWVENRILWMDAHMNSLPTTVDSQEVEPVQSLVLGQNYPNPFNQTTLIPIFLDRAIPVRLTIFNAQGERVWETSRNATFVGRNEIVWNGKDSRGGNLPSGVYACDVHVGKDVRTIKLVLLK